MGAKLCCMSLSTTDFDESEAAIEGRRKQNMKKEAAEEKKRDDHGRWLPPEKKDMRKCTKLATLEEWLLSSPGMQQADGITGGELHVFRQSSKTKKVHPSSSSRVHAELISSCPRIDEEDNNVHEDRGRGKESLEAESRSRKPGRKVKFRRPEADIIEFYSPEADIIEFYSPEGTSEEIDQKQSLPRV